MYDDVVLGGSNYADRMVAAMQRARQALVDANDLEDLRHEGQAGTQLHEAVCAYVAYLRHAGLPPEQVVVLVKRLVVQSETTARDYETRSLSDAVISLAIQEYFRT